MWQRRWRPEHGLPSFGMPSLRLARILTWLAMATAVAPAFGVPPGLTLAADLTTDGRQADDAKIPVVIFFSRARCGWCEKARAEHVNAMAANPSGNAIFRQVDMDRNAPLTDFSGRRTTHRAFAAAHKVRMTPTLMFFAGDGTTLASTIVGYRLPEFYGTIIEDAIEDSRNRLKGMRP
jgi:thioredoxin-related protein